MAQAREVPPSSLDFESGEIDRPVGLSGWLAVEFVEIDGPVLRWQTRRDGRRGVHAAEVPRDLLFRFLALADASDREIASFARRSGLLNGPFDFHGEYHESGEESFDDWRALAGDAHAALVVADVLKRPELPTTDHWSRFQTMAVELVDGRGDEPVVTAFRDVPPLDWGGLEVRSFSASPQLVLSVFVNAWIRRTRTLFTWANDDAPPGFHFHTPGLVGAIGWKLAQALGGGRGIGFCKGCGSAFVLSREHRRWCETCHDAKKPQRAAEKASRLRSREPRQARRLAKTDPSARPTT